jgi:hypothetical protein
VVRQRLAKKIGFLPLCHREERIAYLDRIAQDFLKRDFCVPVNQRMGVAGHAVDRPRRHGERERIIFELIWDGCPDRFGQSRTDGN